MPRTPRPLSREAEAVLSVAVRLEYDESRIQSARTKLDEQTIAIEEAEAGAQTHQIDAAGHWRRTIQSERLREEPRFRAVGKRKLLSELRKRGDPRASRHDDILRSLPKRPANKPTEYPHFMAAAVQLSEAGESPVSMARYGVQRLPNLPDFLPRHLEWLLAERIKIAIRRSRNRS